MSIADKLIYLSQTKRLLREALNSILFERGEPLLTEQNAFREYAIRTHPVLSLFQNGEQGAWYDPSDISTLFQDAAGTTPVTSTGDPVGLMLDKSGNGNHATQAVSAARPIYRTDGELHWLDATAPGVWLNLPQSGLFQNALAGEAFLAAEINLSASTSRAVDISTGSSSNSARFTLYSSVGGNNLMTLGTRRLDSDPFNGLTGPSSSGTSVFSAQRDWGLGSGRLRKNSGEWFVGQSLSTPGATSNTPSLATAMPTSYSLQAASALIYGLIVRRGIATDAEIGAVETYLAKKSGVTLP